MSELINLNFAFVRHRYWPEFQALMQLRVLRRGAKKGVACQRIDGAMAIFVTFLDVFSEQLSKC
jgi:hypothetical protein